MTILRWGFLGTGSICAKFAEGLRSLGGRLELAAVGSRDRAGARAFADRHAGTGCTAYGSYQEVIDDPRVDAVYCGLLNHQHAEWSVRAARAGKAVLCEKPAAMDAAELDGVLAACAAAATFWMEGFMYRLHPRQLLLRRWLREGLIGEVRLAEADFRFDAANLGSAWRVSPEGRLFNRAMGGGALMDVGCYPLSWLRWMAGAEPEAVSASAVMSAGGVDLSVSAALRFPGGLLGQAAASVVAAQPCTARLVGSQGRILVEEPWKGTPGSRLVVERPALPALVHAAPDDGLSAHARQLLHASECIAAGLRESPHMTWRDSRDQARCLDAVRAEIGLKWGDGVAMERQDAKTPRRQE